MKVIMHISKTKWTSWIDPLTKSWILSRTNHKNKSKLLLRYLNRNNKLNRVCHLWELSEKRRRTSIVNTISLAKSLGTSKSAAASQWGHRRLSQVLGARVQSELSEASLATSSFVKAEKTPCARASSQSVSRAQINPYRTSTSSPRPYPTTGQSSKQRLLPAITPTTIISSPSRTKPLLASKATWRA